MDPLSLALILFASGLLLLLAELLLPTHGLLGVLGGCALGGGVIACFSLSPWLGLATLAVLVFSSPFVFMWMMRIWPKTPVGRRLVLNATVPNAAAPEQIGVGQVGMSVTELRPMGECDFGARRVEVLSEYGMIPARSAVTVVGRSEDGRPIVRKT